MPTSERPVIMSGYLVPALIAGTKTQTRRLMKPQPAHRGPGYYFDVQLLHEITDEDAKAEGVEPYTPPHGHVSPQQRVPGPGFDGVCLGDQTHRLPFADLWNKVNSKRRVREYMESGDPGYTVDRPWRTVIDESAAWAANPWVWALTVQKVQHG
jgi:hypothetical protein